MPCILPMQGVLEAVALELILMKMVILRPLKLILRTGERGNCLVVRASNKVLM
jgi:hypothetical protein